MPSRTQNYNLIKPAQDESYDIDQFIRNFDAIDAQLKANADAAAAAQGAADKHTHGNITNDGVGLQYILDSEKKKDEGFAQIGYCEFRKNNKDRKEVQIPHGNCNTGHEVQAIPNVLREEIWRSTSVAEI